MLFRNCTVLSSIEVPKNVERIDQEAFAGCTSLSRIVLPEEGLKEIGKGAFRDCTSLTSIEVPKNVGLIDNKVFVGCSSLNRVTLPEGLKEIKEFAFENCTNLTELKMPNSLVRFTPKAINGCAKLRKIVFPARSKYKFDGKCLYTTDGDLLKVWDAETFSVPSGIKEICESAFKECKSLNSVNVPNGVVKIGYSAFEKCEKLMDVKLPETLKVIESCCFEGCKSLQKIDLPDGITSVSSRVFDGCKNLKTIKLPQNLKSIDDYAFRDCESLGDLTLPASLSYIGVNPFVGYNGEIRLGCIKLNTRYLDGNLCYIKVDEYVPDSRVVIGSSDESVSIREGIQTIGMSAFERHGNLKEITLNKLEQIQALAFRGCFNLERIIINGTNVKNEVIVMGDKGIGLRGSDFPFEKSTLQKCLVFVPDNLLANYKKDDYWREFKNLLPLSELKKYKTSSSNTSNSSKQSTTKSSTTTTNNSTYNSSSTNTSTNSSNTSTYTPSSRKRYSWHHWNSPNRHHRYPVGLSVGYVQKSWTVDDGEETEDVGWWGDDPISGVQAGIRVNPQLDYGLGFNTGLFYEYYYSADKDQFLKDEYGHNVRFKGEYQEHSLYLPINLEYSVHFNEDFRLFVSGGIGLNCVLAASETYTDKNDEYETIEESDIYGEFDYSRFSAMWEFGGGLQYKNFQLRYTYAKGINNIFDEDKVTLKANKPMTIAFSIQF